MSTTRRGMIGALAASGASLGAAVAAPALLDTATVNVMSYYRGIPAVKRWNVPRAR